MLKALMKKQFAQFYALLYRNGKKNEKKKPVKSIGYAFLLLYVVACIGFMFVNVANVMCEPLVTAQMTWLYFAFMGIMAISVGVIGSVFMTQSQLYSAKDNELLLSLPIPPAMLLFVRMIVLWVYTFVLILVIMIPTFVIYCDTANRLSDQMSLSVTPLQKVFWVLITLLLTLFTQSITCVLGWLVALISSRTRNKNRMTVVLSLVFFGLYFYVVSQTNQLLAKLLMNSEAISKKMKASLYPIYQMGLACEGNGIAMLIFAGLAIALFAVIYVTLSKTFVGIITTNKGAAKRVYKKKAMKVASPEQAIFQKEVKRLFGTAAYLLNCGLGAVFLLVGAVAVLVKKQDLLVTLNEIYPGMSEIYTAIAILAVCFIVAVNVVTAPSISLEGNNVWILQSLPISDLSVLKAKIKLQLMFNGIPMAIFALAVDYALNPGILECILILVVPQLFNLYSALFGLMCNLKHPYLNWTSETYAVKRNISVMISLFVNWGVLLAFIIAFVFVGEVISINLFIFICAVIILILIAILWNWMKKKGCRIFAEL